MDKKHCPIDKTFEDLRNAKTAKDLNHSIKNKMNAGEYLVRAKNTYDEKNIEYGNAYHNHGEIMLGLFPNGIELLNQMDFNRFALITMIVSKLHRYCNNFETSHPDSLLDLIVYASMLLEIDNELD